MNHLEDPLVDSDAEYRKRGHGLGEKPADWPAEKPWPPPPQPIPQPEPHSEAKLGRHV